MRRILEVVISGACSIVPDTPFFELDAQGDWHEGTPSEVSVFLPDLTSPNLASWGDKSPKVFRAHHVPVAIFPMSRLSRKHSSMPVSAVFTDRKSKQSWGVIVLKAVQVRIGHQFKYDQGLTFERDKYASPMPEPSQEKSLWWVPRMRELVSAADSLARKGLKLNNWPDLRSEKIRGALYLSGGHASVSDFNRDVKNEPQPWDFDQVAWVNGKYVPAGNPVWKKSIGNEIKFAVQLTERFVDINFHDLENVYQTIRLKVPCFGDPLQLHIANVEPEVAAAFLEGPLSDIEDKNPGDPDFEGHYSVTVSRKHGPVPIRAGNQTGDGARPCSPTIFQGFSS